MNELEALRWILKQPGIQMTVEKNGNIRLRYGYLFDIRADHIIDAVITLQKSQAAYEKRVKNNANR